MRRFSLLWLTVGAALAIKIVVLLQLHDHLLLQPSGVLDDAVYVALGQRVAAGDWALAPEVYYVSPFYIYFVGVLLKLSGGSLVAVRFVQVVLGALAVGLIFSTARRWFGERAAVLAAALAALTGLFSFYEILLLQTSVDPFLTALALYALARALHDPSPRWAVAAGSALGLLAMNRPNALAFLPVAVLGVAWVRGSRAGVVQAGAIGVAALLTLAPVTLRNWIVAGDFVLISSHGGLNFYIGNNERADGTYTLLEGITPSIQGQMEDARRLAEGAEGRPVKASAVSDYFYGLARAWIAANPRDALFLFARKLAYTFNAADLALNYSYTYYSRDEATILKALVVGPWLLVPIGLLGAVAAWPAGQQRAAYAVWIAFIPVYAVAVALFFVSTRYRLPLLVPLCVTSAAATLRIAGAIRHNHVRSALAGTALVVGFAVIANWNVGPDTGRANERTEMVAHLIANGRAAEAEELIGRTAPSHPAPSVLYFRAGRGYLEEGNLPRAVDYLQRAFDADPKSVDVRLLLGTALLRAGRPNEAIPHLRAARDADLNPAAASYELARAWAEVGNKSEAIRALQAAARYAAGGTDWLRLGELAMRLSEPGIAEPLLERAVAHLPERSDARESLGLSLLVQGRAGEAIPELARAASLDPSSATARYNLAVALAQEGRLAEAREEAESALRIRPDYPQARRMVQRLPR